MTVLRRTGESPSSSKLKLVWFSGWAARLGQRAGGRWRMWWPGAAPRGFSAGGGNRRTGRSIPDNARMGAQGTRAIDVARRAGIVYRVHEYAHDTRSSLRDGGRGYALEAVEALGVEPGRVFKTIVVAVDSSLGLAVVPADAEVDLKAVAD